MKSKKTLLVVLSALIILLTMQNFVLANTRQQYRLYKLSYDSKKKDINWSSPVYTSTSFEKTYNKLLSEKNKGNHNLVITNDSNPSPLKIVAADRAYLQTYPYRDGSKQNGRNRIAFGRDIAQLNGVIDVPAYHLMYYRNTQEFNGSLKHEVEMAGKRGFVESEKVDIVPLIYIENKVPITLGGGASKKIGNGSEYQAYSYTLNEVTHYEVKTRNGYKEIIIRYPRTTPLISDEGNVLGLAPDWLQEGIYYSTDGIYFYRDRDLTQAVNPDKPFYAYYQWLPIRTPSQYSEKDFSGIVPHGDSVIKGKEYLFVRTGQKFGINPVLLLAQAIHESGWGLSSISKDKNNLFGWGANDDDSYNEATGYKSISDSIEAQAAINLKNYVSPESRVNYGPSFGNQETGISVRYATDPYYGYKIASMAYDIDKKLGLKDYNHFSFARLKDHTEVPVFKDSKGKNLLYKTEGAPLVNQLVVNLGEENGKIKTYPIVPISNGKAQTKIDSKKYPFSLDENIVYIDKSYLEGYSSENKPTTPPSTPPTRPEPKYEKLVVTLPNHISHLNVRSETNTSSKIIGTLKDGDLIDGYKYNDSWYEVKTSNGGKGYVHKNYIEIYKKPTDNTSKYKIGDVNRDNELSVSDIRVLHRYLMGKESLDAEQLYLGNVQQLYSDEYKNSDISVADIRLIHRHLSRKEKLKGWSYD